MKGLLLFFVLASQFNLGHAVASSPQNEMRAIVELKAATNFLSAENLSCRVKSNCINVGIGQKACGGFQGYVLASKKNLNLPEVRYLARRTVVLESNYNQRYHVISDCTAIAAPTNNCVANKCVRTSN